MKLRTIAAFIGLLAIAHAQTDYSPAFNPSFHYYNTRAGSSVNVCTLVVSGVTYGGCHIVGVKLAGVTAGTANLVDLSTDCGGAGCSLLPAVVVAINTTVWLPLGGAYARGGALLTGTGSVDVQVVYTLGFTK